MSQIHFMYLFIQQNNVGCCNCWMGEGVLPCLRGTVSQRKEKETDAQKLHLSNEPKEESEWTMQEGQGRVSENGACP